MSRCAEVAVVSPDTAEGKADAVHRQQPKQDVDCLQACQDVLGPCAGQSSPLRISYKALSDLACESPQGTGPWASLLQLCRRTLLKLMSCRHWDL